MKRPPNFEEIEYSSLPDRSRRPSVLHVPGIHSSVRLKSLSIVEFLPPAIFNRGNPCRRNFN